MARPEALAWSRFDSAVGHFMDEDVGVDIAIAIRRRRGKDVHLHTRQAAVSAGVAKLALFVPPESCASARTKSLPSPPRPKLFV